MPALPPGATTADAQLATAQLRAGAVMTASSGEAKRAPASAQAAAAVGLPLSPSSSSSEPKATVAPALAADGVPLEPVAAALATGNSATPTKVSAQGAAVGAAMAAIDRIISGRDTAPVVATAAQTPSASAAPRAPLSLPAKPAPAAATGKPKTAAAAQKPPVAVHVTPAEEWNLALTFDRDYSWAEHPLQFDSAKECFRAFEAAARAPPVSSTTADKKEGKAAVTKSTGVSAVTPGQLPPGAVAADATAPANPSAANNLGWCLVLGVGCPQADEAGAVALFQASASAGSLSAYNNWAVCMFLGRGCAKDQPRAVSMFAQLNAKSHRPGVLNYGITKTMERNADLPAVAALYETLARKLRFPMAWEYLAILYLNGDGNSSNSSSGTTKDKLASSASAFPADKTKAIAYMQAAADHGVATAQYNLGCIHADADPNQLLSKDVAKSLTYFECAAAAGHAQAATQAGILRADAGEHARAVAWFVRAAKWGHATAQLSAGLHYLHGLGVPKDERKGYVWIHTAAQSRRPAAIHQLGLCHRDGTGCTRDDTKALQCFEVAARLDFAPSQLLCARYLLSGRHGTCQRDPVAALTYLQQAATKHAHPPAMTLLARLYLTGTADPALRKDERKGVELLARARTAGHTPALCALAEHHLRAHTDTDDHKAVVLLREATLKKDSRAHALLGQCHEEGRGVARDHARAQWLYEIGSGMGSTLATARLGCLLLTSPEPDVFNSVRAVPLLQRAAEKGHALAQSWFGLLLVHGYRVGGGPDATVGLGMLASAAAPTRATQSVDPDTVAAARSLAQYHLATAYLFGVTATATAPAAESKHAPPVAAAAAAAAAAATPAPAALAATTAPTVVVAPDAKRANDLLTDAANAQHADALFLLAQCAAEAQPRPDLRRAAELCRAAAALQHARAQCWMGLFVLTGVVPPSAVHLDDTDAKATSASASESGSEVVRATFKASADNGDASGMYNYALHCSTQSPVKPADVRTYWERSAAQGYAPAYYALGHAHAAGSMSVPTGPAVALDWFRKGAAWTGDARCSHALGVYHATGTLLGGAAVPGSERNDERARAHFRHSADLGVPQSMWNLSVLLARTEAHGAGVARASSSVDSAAWWRERAVTTLKLIGESDRRIALNAPASVADDSALIGLLDPLTYRRERVTSPVDALRERDAFVATQPAPDRQHAAAAAAHAHTHTHPSAAADHSHSHAHGGGSSSGERGLAGSVSIDISTLNSLSTKR